MKSIKYVSMFLLLAFVLPILACSTDPEPLVLSNIPIYPGAKENTNKDLKEISDFAIKQAKADKTFTNVEGAGYVAGKATKWEDIEKFYDAELAKADWKTDPGIKFNDPAVKLKGWIRGKQFLFVGFAADPALPDTVLFVIIGTITNP